MIHAFIFPRSVREQSGLHMRTSIMFQSRGKYLFIPKVTNELTAEYDLEYDPLKNKTNNVGTAANITIVENETVNHSQQQQDIDTMTIIDTNRDMSTNNNIGKAPTVREIISFAVPAIGVWLCNPLLSLIDTSAVGLFTGTLQQAALNPAGEIRFNCKGYVISLITFSKLNSIYCLLFFIFGSCYN